MVETLGRRLLRGAWRERCAPDWLNAVPPDWRDNVFSAKIRDRFHAKQGRSIARWELPGGTQGLTVYLKRHDRAPWWHGWGAALWPGRGWSASWQEAGHLHWAKARGFAVPRVVAVGEQIGPWGRLQSFLAIEELAGCLPLHEAVPLAAATLPPAAFANWKRGLGAELARLTSRLHRLRHFHKDLYFCHFYVPERLTHTLPQTWTEAVSLIDLHRLGHHPWVPWWWQLKDLAQLLYSSEVIGVTARDRLRFWRTYAGPGRRCGWWPWLRSGILLRWWNYRRHHENKVRKRAA